MPPYPHTLRRQLLLAGMACALLASACSKSAKSKNTPLAKEATILCLGDSLTFGYGAPPNAGYPLQLELLTGHVTQNAGVNGDTSEGALTRLPALLQENTPGLVLVSIGGNDFLRRVPIETTRSALRQIIASARTSAQVALIAEPTPDALAAAAGSLKDHTLYAGLAKETGTPLFADGWSYVLSRAELRSDPIHANAEGYKVFATRLAQWLREQNFVV